MTPFEQWRANVQAHPDKLELGEFRWRDAVTGWSVWHANGVGYYRLISPQGGVVKLSRRERKQMHRLLNWWVQGALSEASS